jgi:DNA primase
MDIFSFIKERISIVTVASEYVALKKAGNYLKGQCPLHNERTGSFTLSPAKEIFYCFGCHQGGDLITLVAALERLSPLEAAHHLIERYQLELPQALQSDASTQPLHEQLTQQKNYELTGTVVTDWAKEQLNLSPDAQHYLTQRGITHQSKDFFNIGFFPAGMTGIKSLLKYAQKQGVLAEDLRDASLIVEGKQDFYSPFEERILFPIYDHLGRWRGFGGRIFKAHDTRPKYYNSHEHSFFEKGTLLFGLDKAKKAMQHTTVFLVEGYLDCIAMHQAGYTNTVATLGTACTIEHLGQLARYTQNLSILYDGDAAGKKAVERLAHLCWQVNMELLVIQLPEEEDPASLLARGSSLQEFITAAEDIFIFLVRQQGADFHTKSLSDKLHTIKTLVSLIGGMKDKLKQTMLLKKIATTFTLPLEALHEEIIKTSHTKHTSQEAAQDTPQSKINITILEKKSFYAILNHKSMLSLEDEELLISMLPSILKNLAEKAHHLSRQNIYSFNRFFEELDSEEKTLVTAIDIEMSDHNILSELSNLMAQLYKKKWKMMLNEAKELFSSSRSPTDSNYQLMLAAMQKFKAKLLQRGLL